jgi:hypothetical protein
MRDRPPCDFVYVHTDIPEGMTISEWRAQRATEGQAMLAAARERRRLPAVRRWLSALAGAMRGPRLWSREAQG